MGIINADELAKSYKLSLLKKIKAGDLHDDDLFQVSSIRTNPKYFNTRSIDLEEFTKYIALKIGEHTGVEVTPYHDSGDKIATITVNNVPVDIYASDIDTIAELTDVELTDLADGDILKYDSAAGKWKNKEENTDYVAEQYDPDEAYAVGDYCMHNNKLYKCITAISKVYWYKLPQTFNGSGVSIAFSNTNADPEDTYVSITSNGTWVLASNSSGQVVHCSQFGLNDFSLTYSYQDVYYNADYSNYNQSIIETYFENGGYESANAAIDDLIADRSFDPTKWTEVTVTGEISSALELPGVSAADNDKILKVINGVWGKGDLPTTGIERFEIEWHSTGNYMSFRNSEITYQNVAMAINSGKICFAYRTRNFVEQGFFVKADMLIIFRNDGSGNNPDFKIIMYKMPTTNSQYYAYATQKFPVPSPLPAATSSDEGKVLTVNSSGQWVAADLPDGSNTEY